MALSITPTSVAALQQRLAALAARRGAAGVQYALAGQGGFGLDLCHGLADALAQRPVTLDTTFNAYSIAKVLTAATVLCLAEAGRLDLDAPIGVAAGVEGLEAYGSVRETLLHRAGFRNPNPLKWIHPVEAHAAFDEAAFVCERVNALRGTRRRWARSGYSNLGYLLLGMAIQRATGQPWVQAIKAQVVEPLQFDAESWLDFVVPDMSRHAPGHLRAGSLLDRVLGLFVDRAAIERSRGGGWVQLRLHQVHGSAYGGLVANARGLVRFGQAVLGAPTMLPGAVRRAMIDLVPGPGPRRSLAWFGGTLGGHRWLAHAGGGLGAYGELRVYPDLGVASAVLTNGPGLSDARSLDQIDQAWLDG